MPISFFKQKQKSKPTAVFCLETGSITFTISTGSNGKEEIEYSAKYSLESDETPNAEELVRKTLKAIDTVFEDVTKHRSWKILGDANVIFLLGSPWHISWNDQVSVKKEKKFKVTEKIINDSLQESFTSSHSDLELIGSRIMGYKMNGYTIEEPVGKITNEFTLHTFTESAPKELLKSLKESLTKHLPHARVDFSTYTFAAVKAAQKAIEIKDFLLILPEHEATEVVIVKDSIIESGASIPFGSATLARDIFGKRSSGIREALTKSKHLLEGSLSSQELATATPLLETIKQNFLKEFRDLMWKMNDSVLLPSTILIGGKNLASHCMLEWIQKENYTNETFTLNGFKVLSIGGEDLTIENNSEKKIFFTTAVCALAPSVLNIKKVDII